jgi:glutamine amidotransferase
MIAIVDYGMGNLGSVKNMLRKVGAQAIITSNPEVIDKAEKIILPGVGSFDSGMRNLIDLGLVDVLEKRVKQDKVPVLGICLGVQLMTKGSAEGDLNGLGWFDATAVKFNNDEVQERLLLPNIGWRNVELIKPSKLFENMHDDPRFYFVHSYHLISNDASNVLLNAYYGYDYVAAFEQENILGVQFHPEKSHKYGMKLFENFVKNY